MNCDHNPINYTTDNPFHPDNDIINSTSKLQEPFSFTFPNSPQIMPHLEYYNYDHDYLQFLDLFCPHQYSTATIIDNMPEYSIDQEKEEIIHHDQLPPSSNIAATISKKIKKKDRHSKIETARGPRDRRMRLSLEVARKFFDLQDLLGYDKPSSTVEWLLRNSASSIRDLSINYNRKLNNLIRVGGAANSTTTATSSNTCCEEEVVSSSKNESYKPKKTKKVRSTVPRESRRKARERARERTSQKRRLCTETTGPNIAETSVQDLSSGNYQNNAVFSDQHQQIAELQFCAWEAYNSSNNLSG